ncbi:hypothetical protein RYX56_08465 [Alkalihalophilus lindianensis]|uniref:Transcriptional regulator n=1 Tax=Alkalihalophilus lindianensis TaxID=1630542 RepID=A0ABU3X944_9BACI|nr:hypothetical protein [Alkalihalophilus lindianensis]MDV2684402.1 hypothetical protein [Alkalihalophilus lindianensis]
MYRVGVIGPRSTVDTILHLTKKLESDLQYVGFPYNNIKDTQEIIEKHFHKADTWVFSSKLAYFIAKKVMASEEKLVYIEHTEAGIYKSLLQAICSHGRSLERVSIDELSTDHLHNAMEQLNIYSLKMSLKTFDIDTSTEELVTFHHDLWESGETEAALTCFDEVYQKLQLKKVPSYRISTTEMEIMQTLKIIEERIKAIYFKGTQVAVQLLEIDHYKKLVEDAGSVYNLQLIELKIKERLVQLCESVNGSLIEEGSGCYLIFSSRGAMEKDLPLMKTMLQELRQNWDVKLNVGIGYGDHAYSAQSNAKQAISRAAKASNRIVIVKDDRTVMEVDELNRENNYPLTSTDLDLVEKFKSADINIKNYYKLSDLIIKSGKRTFTVNYVADQLSWDKRNTRRFLNRLVEIDVIAYVGEENAINRGRPQKMYQLK